MSDIASHFGSKTVLATGTDSHDLGRFQINVHLDELTFNKVKDYAIAHELSMGAVLRQLIEIL